MPLQEEDIKIFKSDTMEDTIDGGGEATLSEVISGVSNNMFDDVSTLDRVFGAVHLRKIYPHAFIQTLDKYSSAHTIISKLPKDEKLGINLFTTGDYHDRRPDAQSRIESYRAKGSQYIGFLLATQFKGSRVITIFQSENAAVPQISDVLYLTQDNDAQNQFVKIVSVEESLQTFTIDNQTFKRNILTIELSQSLDYDFVGAQISKDDNLTPQATILKTVVANAAKYFSARPLAEVASEDDTTIKTEGIFSQVVPSSLQEVAAVEVDAVSVSQGILEASDNPSIITTSAVIQANSSIHLGSPCVPDTLNISSTGSSITDTGGKIFDGLNEIGTINYESGVVSFNDLSPTINGAKTISFRAGAVMSSSDSALIEISNGNRGNLYTITILPQPRPGTINVSYRSFGNWYDLFDNGSGGIIADEEGIGAGTINYASGSVTLTLSALPDVGSAIVFKWGKGVNYLKKADITPIPNQHSVFAGKSSVDPATFILDWNDGSPKQAVTNAAGEFSGDATGQLEGRFGRAEFKTNVLPLVGQQFTLSYDFGSSASVSATGVQLNGSGELIVDLQSTNVVAGHTYLSWQIEPQESLDDAQLEAGLIMPRVTVRALDDGNGNMRNAKDSLDILGTINYSTGIITITKPEQILPARRPTFGAGTWIKRTNSGAANNRLSITHFTYNDLGTVTATVGSAGTIITAIYRDSVGAVQHSNNYIANNITVDLSPFQDGEIVDGSVRFQMGGLTYVDRNNIILHSVDPSTGIGVPAGSINRSNGFCAISDWNPGGNPDIIIESLASSLPLTAISSGVLRVPTAPVRLNSFQIRAQPNKVGEPLIVGDADANGNIVGTGIEGEINYETGVVSFRFGESVVAAGNESEHWYVADAVDGDGNIFKPTFVAPASVKYDAVSQSFIPLDANILGLNPVRLPEDGRVPIYAEGDVVVILNEAITSGTYVSSTQTDLGRTRIAKLSVTDANGADIPTAAYTADLDTGLIDWGDLTGITQPLNITHRIEDSVLVTDVQITGDLKLSQPLTHDYPLEGTLVSNAVLHGDVFAFVNQPFDQQTFTGEWSDALIGSQTLAQFNDAAHPIIVDNASAITERWLLQFINSTTVNVIGEFVGQVISGASISNTIAPLNPATGFPYFTINPAAWGVGGWSSGNVLRFNTQSANVPLWVIQSVGQGEATNTDDDALTWCLEFRGDRDTVLP